MTGISREKMKDLDDVATRKYHVTLLQMMELAGHHLAIHIRKNYKRKKNILVAVGGGNNGGGGLVAARHLHNRGKSVSVFLAAKNLKVSVNHQIKTITNTRIKLLETLDKQKPDLVIDALIGYGLKGNLRYSMARHINKVNYLKAPIVSLDVPSGMNANTGLPAPNAIVAKETLTLASQKKGLLLKHAANFTGEVKLVDLGIPREAYTELRISYPF